MTLLFDSLFLSNALGHLSVDILNGQLGIVLVYLSSSIGLSNTILGLAMTLCLITAAVGQPFFGYLADRIGARWIISGGVVWMGVWFSVALLNRGWTSLVFLIIASLGSGAFHAAGAMQATQPGKIHLAGSEATAASLFFVFGQLGYFIGPLAGGPILDRWGLRGLMIGTALALLVGINAAWKFRHVPRPERIRKPITTERNFADAKISIFAMTALVLVAGAQSWAQHNITTFFPKYMSDMGQPASLYGLLSALFMGGGAVGTVAGGVLADRIGKKKVIAISLSLASFPLLAIAMTGFSPALYFLLPLAGALLGGPFSNIIVLSQNNLPGGKGFVSGLTLGFLFSAGALGGMLTGVLADQYGVGFVFYLTAAIALAGGLFSTLINEKGSLTLKSANVDPKSVLQSEGVVESTH